MARPSLYKLEFARQAGILCRLGADYRDLAQVFRVSQATIYRWLDQRTDFAAATAHGRARYESPVGRSRYQRAIGGDYLVERVFHFRGREPVVARYRRRILADPKAALCWLRARRPETWRIGYRAHLKESGEVLPADVASLDGDIMGNESPNDFSCPADEELKGDSHNPKSVNRADSCQDRFRMPEDCGAERWPCDQLLRSIAVPCPSAVKVGWYVGSQNSFLTMPVTCREPFLLKSGKDLRASLRVSATAGSPRARIPAIVRVQQLDREIVLHHPPAAAAAHAFASAVHEARMPARPDMVPRRASKELPEVHRESPICRLSDQALLHSTMKHDTGLTPA